MKKGVLVLLAFLLFIFSSLIILSLSAYSLLYPGVYIESLREAGAFASAEEQLQLNSGASFIKIPSGGMEELVEPLLTNFLAYLRSDTEELKLEVEVDTSRLRKFFLDSVKNVSICAPGQNYSFDDLENICRPADKTPDAFLDELLEHQNKSFFASNTADLVPVYQLQEGSANREGLDKFRSYVTYYKYFILLAILLAILIILGIYFINSKQINTTLGWVGTSLLIAGTSVLIGILYLSKFVINFVSKDPNLSLVRDALPTVISNVLKPVYWYSGGMIIISLACIVCAFILKPKK